jgi:hypothetical protein
MSDSNKISFRLSSALQAALAVHVRQHGGQVPDVIRAALEAYLGLRPTGRPTAPEHVSDTSDTVSDLAARVNALVSDVARLQERLERLDAYLETRPPRVRQRQTPRPTPPQPEPPVAATTADPPQTRAPGGQRKLTPRQVRALRDKHRRGVPVPALMDEYGISRASVFRYLQSDKR